jgi:hypothetical protein
MVRMEHGPCEIREHEGIGTVSHYHVRLTGVDTDFESHDEAVLTALLTDLRDAAVFCDPNPPYWHWKSAFRQLTIQHMAETYGSLYG